MGLGQEVSNLAEAEVPIFAGIFHSRLPVALHATRTLAILGIWDSEGTWTKCLVVILFRMWCVVKAVERIRARPVTLATAEEVEVHCSKLWGVAAVLDIVGDFLLGPDRVVQQADNLGAPLARVSSGS